MNSARIIFRSLSYFRRTHTGVVLGAALATGVLVGALVVGDSVRGTLRQIALNRLGRTHWVMSTGDRTLTRASIERFAGWDSQANTVALEVPGLLAVPGTEKRIGGVRVLGVGDDFIRKLGDGPPEHAAFNDGSVHINQRLARQLEVRPGDEIILRVAKPSALSREIPIGGQTDGVVSLRLKVEEVLPPAQLGDFNLKNEQVAPLNAFVRLEALQEAMGLEGRVNLAVVGEGALPPKPDSAWSLADLQAQVVARPEQGVIELSSGRVFLDPPLAEAAVRLPGAIRSTTYFVNALESGTSATPYSMVAAFDPAESDLLPDDMKEDEIVITQWLADDLKLTVGQTVHLKYFVTGAARRMTQRQAAFKVRAVVPTEPPGGDRNLMPAFPGLSDATSPLNWQAPPEMNIDLSLIRNKDEQYWEEHRGAPKAFVSLAWARENWSTRFGTYTSVRWPAEGLQPRQLEEKILAGLDPARFGLQFRDVRTPALQAASQGYDFGQLFIGFSFFLIVAAMLLTALMFAFGIEQRSPQIGVMLAVGLTPARVRRLMLIEGTLLAMLGAFLGLPLGIAYTKGVLWALANLWQGATGLGSLHYFATPTSLVAGTAAGLAVSVLAMAWVLRQQGQRPVRQLLAARYGVEVARAGRKKTAAIVCAACIVSAVLLGATVERQHAAGAFFGAGALLLIASLACCALLLKRSGTSSVAVLSWQSLGWLGGTRRGGRSLATVSMLACGTFLLIAINAFRHDPGHAPASATLGYELFATTSLPVYHDLNTETGRDFFGLTEREMQGVTVTPLRLLEGDEASCLNLNRPQAPPLLGVSPVRFNHELAALLKPENEGEVAALVDDAVAQWVLKKKIGDTIPYVSDSGRPLNVRIAGLLPRTVMQGYLIVNEAQFIEHFPQQEGYRVFLIDAPPEKVEEVRKSLTFALSDLGLNCQTTAQRLAAFNEVENTYLSIFGILGGLGVLVGCLGVGLIVLRNVLERRAELAAMSAMGYEPADLRRVLLAEHWGLVAMGLCAGLVSALVAIGPSLRTAGQGLPYRTLGWTLLAIGVVAFAWTATAAVVSLRGRLIETLRSE